MFEKHLLIIVIVLINCCVTNAQQNEEQGYIFPRENCLSESAENQIIILLKEKHQESEVLQRYSQKRGNVKFIFPLKYSESAINPGAFAIGSFVDHDDRNGFVRDYNCGKRTYDSESFNHKGTDFFAWPFFWSRMKNDEIEVIAAAEGMIIDKAHGNFDLHCSFCYSCSWNAVYIQHTDGSVAWYGHLKKGNITAKKSGEFVQKGEYLGVAGSSGISQIPHVHFQLWESNDYKNVIDPFIGDCNSTLSESYWEDQETYFVPMVTFAAVDQMPPTPAICRNPYETKLVDSIHAGSTGSFTGYFRDPLPGEKADFKIMNDHNASVYKSWSHIFTTQFAAGWRINTIFLSDSLKAGEYTFEVKYAGTKRSNTFYLINPYSKNPKGRDATIYYDAEQKELNVLSSIDSEGINKVTIYNVQGKLINEIDFEYVHKQSFLSYPAGVYLIYVKDEKGLLGMQKILVY